MISYYFLERTTCHLPSQHSQGCGGRGKTCVVQRAKSMAWVGFSLAHEVIVSARTERGRLRLFVVGRAVCRLLQLRPRSGERTPGANPRTGPWPCETASWLHVAVSSREGPARSCSSQAILLDGAARYPLPRWSLAWQRSGLVRSPGGKAGSTCVDGENIPNRRRAAHTRTSNPLRC